MPTPFTHMAAAEALLARRALPASDALPAGVQAALRAERPAFLFGNTAPDVQTVSGQPREATHFFPVPLLDAPPAGLSLLAAHPALGQREALPAGQAAFLAGYLAHLVFDQIWIRDIFEPYFGPAAEWNDFGERLYLHNVLRAEVDARDLGGLAPAVRRDLPAAEPEGWLPFVDDHHLRAWRDLLADQLSTGDGRTVEVFAQRARIDPREFAALLASPEQMQQRVWSHLPQGLLESYRQQALAASARVIAAYWQGQPLPSQL
jgi:hypothetical protein